MIRILLENECDSKLLGRFDTIALTLFEHLGLKGEAAVELSFVDRLKIRKVNLKTRGIDKETDVLSFPFLDCVKTFSEENYPLDYDLELKAVFLGSILICEDVAKEQAVEYGHSEERELAYLFLHGLLHLMGFDHENDEDRALMRHHEDEILQALNILR